MNTQSTVHHPREVRLTMMIVFCITLATFFSVSQSVDAQVVPTAPSAVTLTANSVTHTMDLSWTKSTANASISGYTITCSGPSLFCRNYTYTVIDLIPNSAQFDVTDWPFGSYTFKVVAYDTLGVKSTAGTSNTLSYNKGSGDIQPPALPTALSASGASSLDTYTSGVFLSWTAPLDNVAVAGYYVYRVLSTAGVLGDPELIGITAKTSFTDLAVAESSSYVYAISAFDAQNNGSLQTSVAVTLPTYSTDTIKPTAPSAVTLTGSAVTQSMDVSWTKSTDNKKVIGGYYIYCVGPNDVYCQGVDPQNPLGSLFLGMVSPNETSFHVDTTGWPFGYYTFKIVAVDLSDNPSPIGTSNVIPYTDGTDIKAPSVPASLSATTFTTLGGVSAVRLSWALSTDPTVAGQTTSGVAGYNIYQDGELISTVTKNFYTDFDFTSLLASAYPFTVSAFDVAGNESAQSPILSVPVPTAKADTLKPTTPSAVTLTVDSAKQTMNLSWTRSTDTGLIASYLIYCDGPTGSESCTNDINNYFDILGPDENSYSIDASTLPSGTYTFKIVAEDLTGNQSTAGVSNSVSFTNSGVVLPPQDPTPPDPATNVVAKIDLSTRLLNISWANSSLPANTSRTIGVVCVGLSAPCDLSSSDGKRTLDVITTSSITSGQYSVWYLPQGDYVFQISYFDILNYFDGSGRLVQKTTSSLSAVSNIIKIVDQNCATSFTIPQSSNSLTVAVSNAKETCAVVSTYRPGFKYFITESPSVPNRYDSQWTTTAPTSYTFDTYGQKTLYLWVSDLLYNVIGNASQAISLKISDPTAPSVTAFVIPAKTSSLTVPVSSFISSDNISVTGYILTESQIVPLPNDPRWTSTAPTSYSFDTYGPKTLYAWVKDDAGNISTNMSRQTELTLRTFSDTLTGYAWSSSVGWISFSGTTQDGQPYGVKMNPDGTLIGYAWSSNVGWIQFGGLDITMMPGWTGAQRVNTQVVGNKLIGFARVCSATQEDAVTGLTNCSSTAVSPSAGEFDGWINFSYTDPKGLYSYSVVFDEATGVFQGHAWGSPAYLAWIDFSPSGVNCPSGSASPCKVCVYPCGDTNAPTVSLGADHLIVVYHIIRDSSGVEISRAITNGADNTTLRWKLAPTESSTNDECTAKETTIGTLPSDDWTGAVETSGIHTIYFNVNTFSEENVTRTYLIECPTKYNGTIGASVDVEFRNDVNVIQTNIPQCIQVPTNAVACNPAAPSSPTASTLVTQCTNPPQLCEYICKNKSIMKGNTCVADYKFEIY